jgi:hypothetical protein
LVCKPKSERHLKTASKGFGQTFVVFVYLAENANFFLDDPLPIEVLCKLCFFARKIPENSLGNALLQSEIVFLHKSTCSVTHIAKEGCFSEFYIK